MNGNKFPWYRERLRNKYSKDVNPILNHKNWTFVRNGLDDFRDGMPPDPGHGKPFVTNKHFVDRPYVDTFFSV